MEDRIAHLAYHPGNLVRRPLCALFLALCMALCACSGSVPASVPASSPSPLPVSAQGENPPRILSSTLYFPDSRGVLVAEIQNVEIPEGVSLPEALLSALMLGPSTEGLYPIRLGENSSFEIETSGDTVTVDMIYPAARTVGPEDNASFQDELLILRMAVTNTLTELPNIHYVNVLLNSQAMYFDTLPAGVNTRTSGDYRAQKYARSIEAEAARGVQREISVHTAGTMLYYGDRSGSYLLPEVRSVVYYQLNYYDAILDALLRGPDDRSVLTRLLPNQRPWFNINTLYTDHLSLDIECDPQLFEWFDAQKIDPFMAMGSLFLSIMSYYPDLEDITCSVGGVRITVLGDYPLENGIAHRSDFATLIGANYTVYFPTLDGQALLPALRTTGHREADSSLEWLRTLVLGPSEEERDELLPAFPNGVQPEHIQSVQLSGSTAVVTLNPAMQSACGGMTLPEERAMVYSIVNTLTTRPGISWVRLVLPDGSAPAFSGHLDLSVPLMRAPSLIRPAR